MITCNCETHTGRLERASKNPDGTDVHWSLLTDCAYVAAGLGNAVPTDTGYRVWLRPDERMILKFEDLTISTVDDPCPVVGCASLSPRVKLHCSLLRWEDDLFVLEATTWTEMALWKGIREWLEAGDVETCFPRLGDTVVVGVPWSHERRAVHPITSAGPPTCCGDDRGGLR